MRFGLGALLVGVLVCVAGRDARAQIIVQPGQDPPAQKGTFDRDSVLAMVLVVDGASAAWTACSLATGNHSGTADALVMIGTAPSIIFGSAVLGQDAHDPALWIGTLTAGALFTIAIIDIFRESAKATAGDGVTTFSKTIMVVPRVEPVPNERSTRVGLAIAGMF